MSKQFVSDLEEKDSVESIFIAMDKSLSKDRNGKSIMSLNLKDASGMINARQFENVDSISDSFEAGDFVKVKGHVQIYQNRKQIVIHQLKRAEHGEFELKDFVPESKCDPQQLYATLMDLVNSIENEPLKDLMKRSLEDEEVKRRLLVAPAAKTIHHAYLGGLLEHIISICNVMEGLSRVYTYLDRDLLLFGAIFHDLGKIWELNIEDGIQYSDEGRLVGHMVLACDLVERVSSQILGFPAELKMLLKHIILSHHGRLEYGSPKRPKTPEAMVVAMVDDMDSKLDTMLGFMRAEMGSNERWTRYHQGFDRYFYLETLRDREGKED